MPLVEPSLDLALARAGDGAFVIGADSRIVLWNRSAERILGYTPRDVIGRPCCDVFVGHDALRHDNLRHDNLGLVIHGAISSLAQIARDLPFFVVPAQAGTQ